LAHFVPFQFGGKTHFVVPNPYIMCQQCVEPHHGVRLPVLHRTKKELVSLGGVVSQPRQHFHSDAEGNVEGILRLGEEHTCFDDVLQRIRSLCVRGLFLFRIFFSTFSFQLTRPDNGGGVTPP